MTTSEVVRVDSALVERARAEGSVMGRSTAAQLSHWARLGRALEHSRVSTSTIHAVLAGQARFDDLDADEQQAVSDLWSEQMTGLIAGLDLRRDFEAAGQAYAELDDDGNVIEVDPARSGGHTAARP